MDTNDWASPPGEDEEDNRQRGCGPEYECALAKVTVPFNVSPAGRRMNGLTLKVCEGIVGLRSNQVRIAGDHVIESERRRVRREPRNQDQTGENEYIALTVIHIPGEV